MTLSNHGHHVLPLSLSSWKQTPRSCATWQGPYPHDPPFRMEPAVHERHWVSPGPVHDVQLAKQDTHDDMLTCQKVEEGQVLPQRPDEGFITGDPGEHDRHRPAGEQVAQSAGQGRHRLSTLDVYAPSGQVVTHVPVGVAYLLGSAHRVH